MHTSGGEVLLDFGGLTSLALRSWRLIERKQQEWKGNWSSNGMMKPCAQEANGFFGMSKISLNLRSYDGVYHMNCLSLYYNIYPYRELPRGRSINRYPKLAADLCI
jgi:hypothetical protein